jgi:hypothetical protein
VINWLCIQLLLQNARTKTDRIIKEVDQFPSVISDSTTTYSINDRKIHRSSTRISDLNKIMLLKKLLVAYLVAIQNLSKKIKSKYFNPCKTLPLIKKRLGNQ